ncbi:MAG TPA: CHRD domain-containing protein [Gammaproteobacteria bacterium]
MERSAGRFAVVALCSSWLLGAAAQDGGGPARGEDSACAPDDDHGFDLDFDDDDDLDARRVAARLDGVCEVPSISTTAQGTFTAEIDDEGRLIVWTLTYQDLSAPVQQAHIHFGERHTNGGISAFLCSNLGNAPAATQACPETTATINGTITPELIVGPAEQGIGAGEIEELIRGIRSGAAYVNVHTMTFPAGEIRGQVVGADDDDGGDVISSGAGQWDY